MSAAQNIAYALKGLPRDRLFIQTKTRATTAEMAKADINRFIEELDAPLVIEHISRFFKADMVLSEIPGGLAVSPCEAVRHISTIYTPIHTIARVELTGLL